MTTMRGIPRRALLATALAALLAAPLGPLQAQPHKAPGFKLEGTSGLTRTLASYSGRVALLMYEDRDSGEVNAALKTEVDHRIHYDERGRDLVVVPIADLRNYNRFGVRPFVRRAVVGKARSLGVEILLDWSGDILRAYGFVAPGSNVALVGRDGSLVYFKRGPLDQAERRRFHQALSEALAVPFRAAQRAL
jgi:hypothetical protein